MTQTAFVYTEARKAEGGIHVIGKTVNLRPVSEREVAKVPMEHLSDALNYARSIVPVGTYFTHNPTMNAYRVTGHHIDCKTNKVFLQYVPVGPAGVPHPDSPSPVPGVVMGRPFDDFVEDRFIRMDEPDGQLFAQIETPQNRIAILEEIIRSVLAVRGGGEIETMYREDVDYRTILTPAESAMVAQIIS